MGFNYNGCLKVLSLCAGIGAFEKALVNLGIEFDLINYCEIDKMASRSYSLIHGVSEDKNLWDVTAIDINKLSKDVDLLVFGSPCTDFSIAGLQAGGDRGSGTRSSILWNIVDIIQCIRPKVLIWENVKNVIAERHSHNIKLYLDTLESYWYVNHYKVLNARDYGIPQNRERIFVVSILDNAIDFRFPSTKKCTTTIYDLLETEVDDKFYKLHSSVYKAYDNKINLCGGVGIGYNTRSREFSGFKDYCPTLCARDCREPKVYKDRDGKLRNLTPLEYFRFMGFSDEDYKVCKDGGISKSALYKQVGNSIAVNVLECIFRELYMRECVDTSGF